jgi:hypothetical protein
VSSQASAKVLGALPRAPRSKVVRELTMLDVYSRTSDWPQRSFGVHFLQDGLYRGGCDDKQLPVWFEYLLDGLGEFVIRDLLQRQHTNVVARRMSGSPRLDMVGL